MDSITLIGIDLGKHSVHLHGQDKQGHGLLRKKLSRKQLLEFLPLFMRVRLSWRHAPGPIIWRAS